MLKLRVDDNEYDVAQMIDMGEGEFMLITSFKQVFWGSKEYRGGSVQTLMFPLTNRPSSMEFIYINKFPAIGYGVCQTLSFFKKSGFDAALSMPDRKNIFNATVLKIPTSDVIVALSHNNTRLLAVSSLCFRPYEQFRNDVAAKIIREFEEGEKGIFHEIEVHEVKRMEGDLYGLKYRLQVDGLESGISDKGLLVAADSATASMKAIIRND